MFIIFFFNETATTEIYTYLHTLSLHDALPVSTRTISARPGRGTSSGCPAQMKTGGPERPPVSVFIGPMVSGGPAFVVAVRHGQLGAGRSEEHTSELQH